MLRLFRYETPYDHPEAANPLFAVGARRVRWVNSPDTMCCYHRRVAGGVSGVTIVIAGLLAALFWSGGMRQQEAVFASLLVLTGGSVLIGLGVDFFCVLYGVNSMASLYERGMTDFLQVTTVDPLVLVLARLRLARLYAWRAFFVLALLRWVILALLAVWVVMALASVSARSDEATELAFFLGLAAGGLASAAVFLLREPYWRYHAMTAIGVQQAAEHPNPFSRFVWAVLAVAGFWAVQGVVLLMGGYALGMGVAVLSAVMIGMADAQMPVAADALIAFGVALIGSLLPLVYLWIVSQITVDYVPGRSLRRSALRFLGRV